MRASTFVIVGVILTLTETRLGRSQTDEGVEPSDEALRQECPSGTPYLVNEGKVCNKTSLCRGDEAARYCHCDEKCLFYGDCCINAPNRDSNANTAGVPYSNDFQYEKCQPIDREYNGFYMISRCPETSQDDNTRTLCETDPDYNPKNMFLLTPVTDFTNGRLFRNLYCAMCHKTALKDVYFWKLRVDCYDETNDDKSNNDLSTAEPTAIPDDEGTGIDDGTSVSEEDKPVVDDGTSVSENDNGGIEDGTSVSENERGAVDDGTSISEDYNGAIDDGTSVSQDDNPVIDDGTSVSENDNGAIDDGTSVSEDDTSVIDDGTSVSENDNGAIDDGTSVSEDDNPVVDDGTSVFKDDNGVIDDGTLVFDTTTSEGYGQTQSPDVLYTLSLLSDPSCKVKFYDRYPQDNPYRKCKVFHVGHYVNDGGQKIPCPSYLDPYFTNGVIYKNRDCASCNNATMSSPACVSSIFRTVGRHKYSNLFLHSYGYQTSSAGDVIPSVCTGNEVYDPYSHLCRPLATFAEPAGLSSEKPQNFSDVTGQFYFQNAGCISNPLKVVNGCEGIDHILRLSFESLITSFLPNFNGSLKNISTSCYPHKDVAVCKNEPSNTSICTFRGLLKSESIGDVTKMEPHMIGELLDENYRHHGCASELTIDIQEIFITTSAGSSRCDRDSLVSSNQPSGLAFTWEEERKMTVVTSEEQKCPGEMKCSWSPTLFENSEYVFDGSDVFLKTLKQHLSKDRYRKMGNGSIAACVNLEHDQIDVKKQRQEKVQIILTNVGGSLSVVCLMATVLTYLIFPKLRNNVGKTILSLVLSLLIAQLCQLALWERTKNEGFCTFVAILSHYSFLAVFVWMKIFGFDLSRTFGSRSKMQAVRDSRKVFFFYSLYGWLSPLLIVGVCMAIHFGKFEKLNAANEWVPILQYGSNQICWIVDQFAVTYAFGVPIAVLLLCNAVFLADTVFGIFSTRAATRRATQTNPQLLRRDGKRDFLLFCKLSCIMGITWVFGFIAAFIDNHFFHVIFILLNSTQGIFIFIAFGCNDRVIDMWKSKYSTKQKLPSTKSNSCTATAKTSVNSVSEQLVNQIRIKREQERFNPV